MSEEVVSRLNAALEGRYRVERKLGEGGMATVYLAEDLRHDRRVALKVLKPELAAIVEAERFLAEIKTTANLQHPHILPLHDSGEVDGELFYVMPYVRGDTLRERIERTGSLPVGDAVTIAQKLAGALQAAHRQGVIHRDVKPSNVLLADGEPLLADFGIALGTDTEREARLTETGHSIGTPGFMSPEQASGERDLDERSDIYALGALLYAMLAGRPPYADATPRAALARMLTRPPPDVAEKNPNVSAALSRAVRRAMARDADDRFQSASEMADTLATLERDQSRPGRPLAYAGVAVAAVALTLGVWVLLPDRTDWARTEAVPEIQRLLGEGEQAAAFALASAAVEALPDDPVVGDLYEAASVQITLSSVPSGATVRYRPYRVGDTTWTELGSTPIRDRRLPHTELLAEYTLEGFWPHYTSFIPLLTEEVVLTPRGEAEAETTIAGGTYQRTGSAVILDMFRIDTYEVSNSDYRAFVASGGYEPGPHWNAVAEIAPEYDAERADRDFVDRTGRPGPSTWELGRPPEGEADHPVRGVSWFEAAAFCSARGKGLATYYHWKWADGGDRSPWDGVLRHANVNRNDGTMPVGAAGSYGARGVADMAGNAREWVWNAAGDDRYILGGSWRSPPHMYTDYDATSPWSREIDNGFRCARYREPPAADLIASIEIPVYDFSDLTPPDDETFAALAAFYDYDPAPLSAERRVVAETSDWTREHVTFDAAYLDERVPAHVFVPKGVQPPYQSVVYMPGASGAILSSSENISEMSQLMFLPVSGRALVYPVLNGMYERRWDRPSRGEAETRQRYVWMAQDIMRTVDYLVERDDFDPDRIAYMGLSFGAELAVPIALEKRFAATVLVGAALDPAWVGNVPDEAAPWNFVSRITTPSLVINGRHDFMHPFEEGQVPFFEAIDVPDSDKEFIVLPTGHVPANNEVIRETLRWLDERLGPIPGR